VITSEDLGTWVQLILRSRYLRREEGEEGGGRREGERGRRGRSIERDYCLNW